MFGLEMIFAALMAQAPPVLQVADRQGGVAGISETRMLIRWDGSWEVVHCLLSGGKERHKQVIKGRIPEGLMPDYRAWREKVRKFEWAEERYGEPQVVNDHQIVVLHPLGWIRLVGLPPSMGDDRKVSDVIRAAPGPILRLREAADLVAEMERLIDRSQSRGG